MIESLTAWFVEEDAEWTPVSKPAFLISAILYGMFLLYAAMNKDGFLFIDNANLVVHEGGHALFGWFGYKIGILGGTLLQWLWPVFFGGFFFFFSQIFR